MLSRSAIGLICTAVALGVGSTSAAPQSFPKIASYCKRADFRSVGTTIRADLCLPPGAAAPAPTVLVLHGCGGFGTLDQVLARDLPDHGVATLYVDYFGPTPAPSRKGFCNARRGIEGAFPIWERVTLDAVKTLRHTTGVDPTRIGAVGWSLGGGLALLTAEEHGAQHPFRALVLFSSFAFGATLQAVRALPPTLVLSGGSGDAVPVSDAVALYRALRQAHVPSALHVYPHGNHQWKHAQGAAGERWTAAFLERYLVAS